MKTCIMIALDFAVPNFPAALCTLVQWAECAKESMKRFPDFEIVFGVSTTSDSPGWMIDLVVRYLHPLSIFWWDNEVNANATKILADCPTTKKCLPFYPEFSYGNIVNRLLLLANCADCEYLVRVDPGTHPSATMSDLESILCIHIGYIKDNKRVVSQGYDDRLALRHTFINDGDKEKQEKLVLGYTGIDPTKQITGGALWTSNVPGVPAMVFERYGPLENDLTFVWGSDDAAFQIFGFTAGSKKFDDSNKNYVSRFDPDGMRKPTVAYYRGVAGMVYLAGYLRLKEHTLAHEATIEFVDVLRDCYLDPKKYRPVTKGVKLADEFVPKNVVSEAFMQKIRQGVENHANLMQDNNWHTIALCLKEKLEVGKARA